MEIQEIVEAQQNRVLKVEEVRETLCKLRQEKRLRNALKPRGVRSGSKDQLFRRYPRRPRPGYSAWALVKLAH